MSSPQYTVPPLFNKKCPKFASPNIEIVQECQLPPLITHPTMPLQFNNMGWYWGLSGGWGVFGYYRKKKVKTLISVVRQGVLNTIFVRIASKSPSLCVWGSFVYLTFKLYFQDFQLPYSQRDILFSDTLKLVCVKLLSHSHFSYVIEIDKSAALSTVYKTIRWCNKMSVYGCLLLDIHLSRLTSIVLKKKHVNKTLHVFKMSISLLMRPVHVFRTFTPSQTVI